MTQKRDQTVTYVLRVLFNLNLDLEGSAVKWSIST